MKPATFYGLVVLLAVALIGGVMWRWLGPMTHHSRGGGLEIRSVLGEPSGTGFRQATIPRVFEFPADHGPHPEFRQEWWYVTGNLESDDGKSRFGYQLTLFRVGLDPNPAKRESAWGASQLYLGHLAVSDVTGDRFHHFQKVSRGALGLAGADAERVWLEGWSLARVGGTPAQPRLQLTAAQDAIQLQLELNALKPVVLQGERGLSRKSDQTGAASYYYSLTRLETRGELRLGERIQRVRGASWMDREWSTSALAPDQVGWDWFSLQLDDGWEVMFYRMRLKDGADDPQSQGTLVAPDGRVIPLRREAWRQENTGSWTSSATGIRYPSGWRVVVPEQQLELTLTPRIKNQELAEAAVHYWEGAVEIQGRHGERPVSGFGYVELTGYPPSSP
ncbi:MAG: carotenoid 1,2-hydratase [Magnetococcales bacterium]|nr:carotenoid 1,2-hydratase [Magnetococcales bacterium]